MLNENSVLKYESIEVSNTQLEILLCHNIALKDDTIIDLLE